MRALHARLRARSRQWIAQQRYASSGSTVRYLVIDGYTKAGRDDLEAGGATTAGGLYAAMLAKCTPLDLPVQCDIVCPADPDFVLPDLKQYHGVGWSGSSLTVYAKNDDRIERARSLALQCYAHGIPQFGSCFGAQLAVATANGVVQKNPFGKEVGIARKISLTPAGRTHPMYEGKPSVFGGFTSHNDHITHIGRGCMHLASNAFTSVQAVAVRHLNGEFWGLQYHPEYDLHELARLLHCRRKVSIQLGFFRDLEQADAFIEELETLSRDLSRTDIAWRLGIDSDVLDETVRLCEVNNFVRHLVLPYKRLVQQPRW